MLFLNDVAEPNVTELQFVSSCSYVETITPQHVCTCTVHIIVFSYPKRNAPNNTNPGAQIRVWLVPPNQSSTHRSSRSTQHGIARYDVHGSDHIVSTAPHIAVKTLIRLPLSPSQFAGAGAIYTNKLTTHVSTLYCLL